MEKNNGITLISLVVTIIILIILAGVSINLLIGQYGIVTRAKEAKESTEIANITENIKLELLDKQIEEGNTLTQEQIETVLIKYGTIIYKEDGTTIKGIITKEKGYEILLSEIYNGTIEDKEPIFTTVANAPDISEFNKENTYYVSWNLSNSTYAIDDTTLISNTAPSNWYDYTAETNKWANVKTTGGGNDCYWVWIPRYAYKVPTRSEAQTIEIKFLKDDTNIPIGETTEITNTTPTPGTWVVHPAFTNNGNGGFGELTGIWVAKFEASSSKVSENTVTSDLATTGGGDTNSLQVRVKPNVTSWRGITVNNIFTVCRNLTTSGNSVEGATNIDSHMIKNSEWGAVAYLSRSRYGKNSAVWNNPYYNNTKNYSPITGLCGTTQDASQTSLTNTYKYNEVGGENASTTGNVYGVYDMAGGAWEYVAGYLSEITLTNYTTLANADNKYKDTYAGNSSTDTTNYNANTDKYGDAMYETSTIGTGTASWDSDYSVFASSSIPVFRRGGRAGNGSDAGVFAFTRDTGDTDTNFSFRPCLVSPQ